MSHYARMMLHRPSGGTSHLKNYIAQLEQIEEVLCRIYAERTSRTVEDIRTAYIDGKEHWLTANEALSLGFVDEIYDDAREVSFSDARSPHERCERYTAFVEMLQTGEDGWLDFYFPEMNRHFHLFYREASDYQQLTDFEGEVAGKFAVKLREPQPLF